MQPPPNQAHAHTRIHQQVPLISSTSSGFLDGLECNEKRGLVYRWNISIVGGVDRMPGFIWLLRGNRLQVAAVSGMQIGNKQRVENARKALEDGHLLTVDTYASQKQADMEDVLAEIST